MKQRAVLVVMTALAAAPRVSQAQTSPFIPLDHWAMPLVEHLIRAGVMDDPDPMTRPLRRAVVATALDAIDLSNYPGATHALVEKLRAEFGASTIEFSGGLDTFFGGGARSHARRDPLFPAGDGGPVALGGFHLWVAQGPLALSSGGLLHSNIRRDPDYTGTRDFEGTEDPVSGRGQNGYASLEASWGEIVFGNLARNWGPQGFPGLLFSNSPYSYSHFSARLKTKHVWIETAVSRLNDLAVANDTIQRYWIVHRATGHLTDWLKIWLNQGTLLSGPNRGLEPWALNPFWINHLSMVDEDIEIAQKFLEGAVWLQLGATVLTGNLLIDDFPVNSFFVSPIPSRLAGTLAAQGNLGGQRSWSAGYTLVSSLAYRTFSPAETATRRGVGLGRNFSDYDQLTVRATQAAPRLSVVGAEVTLLRRGEGDIRAPWPDVAQFPTLKFVHEGVVEKTLRVAASLDSRPHDGLSIRGRAGLHFISDAGNTKGASDTRFVGEIEITKYFQLRF